MIVNAKRIGVDAGMIIIADLDYLESQKYDKRRIKLGKTINVPAGNYDVAWSIKNTWNGDIDGIVKNVEITSGKIAVIDPCYVLQNGDQERWQKWLNDNDYGKNIKSNSAFIIAEMGGDGLYNVELEFYEKT